MKKIKIKGKLSFNKEKISILNEGDASNIVGGKIPPSDPLLCYSGDVCFTWVTCEYSYRPNATCDTTPCTDDKISG